MCKDGKGGVGTFEASVLRFMQAYDSYSLFLLKVP